MKRIPSTVRRGLAGLLFVTMLTLGILKAQGCQRPVDESPEAEPVVEQPEVETTPQQVDAPQTTAQPAAVAETDAPDAGADSGAPTEGSLDEPRPMMPATKSGMPVHLQPNKAPQPQQQNPK